MSELKTKPNQTSVTAFIKEIEDPQKRADAKKVASIMREITGSRAKMWGSSIVGFGRYRYRYESGREGEWMLTGFSPRKQALTLYIMSGFGKYGTLMKKLGKYKTGKSCLYIKRLSDIDETVLRQLIAESVKHLRKNHAAD